MAEEYLRFYTHFIGTGELPAGRRTGESGDIRTVPGGV
jgi:hypothetical protein